MRLLKWFGRIFNFGAKYRKEEEKYHNESKKHGPTGHLISLILTSLIPIVALIAAFEVPWSNNLWIVKVLCILTSLMITTAPTELFILGVVALRHRIRMRVQNKVENEVVGGLAEAISGKEMTEEDKQHLEERKARGTQDKMDLVIGILGITMSVVVVIAFISILFGYITFGIKRLK